MAGEADNAEAVVADFDADAIDADEARDTDDITMLTMVM